MPGKAVGPASNKVTILYTSVAPPPVEFNFVDCYKYLHFELETLTVLEDQMGSGDEEYWIAGFVHETLAGTEPIDGVHDNHGPIYRVMDPSGPHTTNLTSGTLFQLGNPTEELWPRVYTVMFSIMEEDGGSALQQWQAGVWQMANLIITPDVGDFINEYLQEHYSDYIEDIVQAAQTAADVAQLLATLIGGTAGGIAGLVVAAAAFVIGDIISGSSDDYYGTEFRTFVLPTPAQDYVHSLPGTWGKSGTYTLDPVTVDYYGSTSYPEATAHDGQVQLRWSWKFWGKETY